MYNILPHGTVGLETKDGIRKYYCRNQYIVQRYLGI